MVRASYRPAGGADRRRHLPLDVSLPGVVHEALRLVCEYASAAGAGVTSANTWAAEAVEVAALDRLRRLPGGLTLGALSQYISAGCVVRFVADPETGIPRLAVESPRGVALQ